MKQLTKKEIDKIDWEDGQRIFTGYGSRLTEWFANDFDLDDAISAARWLVLYELHANRFTDGQHARWVAANEFEIALNQYLHRMDAGEFFEKFGYNFQDLWEMEHENCISSDYVDAFLGGQS